MGLLYRRKIIYYKNAKLSRKYQFDATKTTAKFIVLGGLAMIKKNWIPFDAERSFIPRGKSDSEN